MREREEVHGRSFRFRRRSGIWNSSVEFEILDAVRDLNFVAASAGKINP
jgi:hypothetical protein